MRKVAMAFGLLAGIGLGGGLPPAADAAPPATGVPPQVQSQPLVDTAWLKQHLRDSNLVVVDVFEGDERAAFAAGHIPGAHFTDYTQGWRVKVGTAPGMLPPVADAEKLIGALGIDNQSHVVLVPGGRDHSDFNAIARVYWTFKVLGHDQVSILNGGDKAWLADSTAPVETGNGEKIVARTFTAHFRPELLATREEVKQALGSKTIALVDARPQPQFEGKAKAPTVRVAGTLPGAVNAPATSLVAADGTRLVDQSTIRAILDKAGIKPKEEQISFCNTGHFAAGTWFVLHEVEGNSKAKLYAGSMSDWTGDPQAPVVPGQVGN